MPRGRRERDFYETGAKAVRALLAHVDWLGLGDGSTLPLGRYRVFEPCAGRNAITKPLRAAGLYVVTGDLVEPTGVRHDVVGDARYDDAWRAAGKVDPFAPNDWTVTNPPFSDAYAILLNAWRHSQVGVAFLLRLSFLEPTRERGQFLAENPPSDLIVLPRYSFTGDGSTDSVTCAWMVWYPRRLPAHRTHRIVIASDVVGRPLLDRQE